MNWIKRAWRGEERLWKVFWVYGSLAGFLEQIITVIGLSIILPHVQIVPWHAPVWAYVLWAVWVVFISVYAVWFLVAFWRCTFNTNRRFWAYAARAAFICAVALEVAGFGESSEKDDWTKGWSIDCEKIMRNYAAKHNLDPDQYVSQNHQYLHDCANWPKFYEAITVSVKPIQQ